MHRKAETKGAAEAQDQSVSTDQAQGAARSDGPPSTGGDLDFEALDLSIETVEERISPSETNVFDK
ncbi:MAG: hypothetical protein R3F49_04065 [Planctomycetota bacterium]